MIHGLSLTEVSHVIALATAPSFLLGAVVAFLSLLLTRAGRISDRLRLLDHYEGTDERHRRIRAELPRLRHRARLVHLSIVLACASGGGTALLVVVAFVGALTGVQMESAVAVLFVFSLAVFVAALYLFAHEAMLNLGEFKAYLER